MPKNILINVYTCNTRVRSLVSIDDGEDLPAGTEGTIVEARVTRAGVEYLVDFDGSAFESSSMAESEIEEVPADASGFRAVYAPHENQWRWMNPDTSIIAARGDSAKQAQANAAMNARSGLVF